MGTICSSIFNKSYVHYTQTNKTIKHPTLHKLLVFQDDITGNLVHCLEININELNIKDQSNLERHQLFSHPNILRFEGFKKNDEVNYLALFESYECTFEEEIQQKKKKNEIYKENEILGILQNISAALAYFQKKDIYHGQVRPENIVKKGDEYKLLDLVLFDKDETTYDLVLKDENNYNSRFLTPELKRNLPASDKDLVYENYKQDIYALGIIVLDALALNTSNSTSEKIQSAEKNYSRPLVEILAAMINDDENQRMDAVSCNRLIENIYYGFDISDDRSQIFMGNTLKNKVSSVISLYSESDKVQDQKYQPQIQKNQNFTSNKISKSETNKYDIIKLIDGKHTENSPKNLNLEPYLNSPQVLEDDLPHKSESDLWKELTQKTSCDDFLLDGKNFYQIKEIKQEIELDHKSNSFISPKKHLDISPQMNSELETYQLSTKYNQEKNHLPIKSSENKIQINKTINIFEQDQNYSSSTIQTTRNVQNKNNFSPQHIQEPNILMTEPYTYRYNSQVTSSHDYSDSKPKDRQFIFTTSPDQNLHLSPIADDLKLSSQDFYGAEKSYSLKFENIKMKDAYSHYDPREGNYDTYRTNNSLAFKSVESRFESNFIKSNDIIFQNPTASFIQSEREKKSYLEKSPYKICEIEKKDNENIFQTYLGNSKGKKFINKQQSKNEFKLEEKIESSLQIDEKIKKLDSILKNVNILSKKIAQRSPKFYDKESLRAKYESLTKQKLNKSDLKLDDILYDTMDTKISNTETKTKFTSSYNRQSLENSKNLNFSETSTRRTMGYALEILRNDIKHNFLTEIDDFIHQRSHHTPKKKSNRVQTLENEIEDIRTSRAFASQKITTESEDLGIIETQFSRDSKKNNNMNYLEIISDNKIISSEKYKDGSRYNGEIQGGLRHGYGKLIYSDGTWFEGSWQLDKIEGYGVFYSSSNKLSYEGEWRHNKRNGQGIMFNEFPQEMNESHLKRSFNKKENAWIQYEGEFVNDEWNGIGKLVFSNGEIYHGSFKKGVIHGKGNFHIGKMIVPGEWNNNSLVEIF